MKRKLVTLLLTMCLVAGGMSGCGTTEDADIDRESESSVSESRNVKSEVLENLGQSEEAVGTEESGEAEDDFGYTEEELALIKYNLYVQLNNEIVDILDNIDEYYLVVNYEEEFSLTGEYDYYYIHTNFGGFDEDLLADCVLVSDWAPHYEEMDRFVKDMEEPLLIMSDLCDKLRDSSDLTDNQYQLAKEYHQLMWTYSADVYAMGIEFMNLVDEMADERIEEEEKKMLEEELLIQYNSSHALTLADNIMDECQAQGVWDENLSQLDLTEINKMYEELTETVAAYDAAVKDSEQVVKESLAQSAPFDNLLNLLCWSVEEMISAANQGTDYTEGGSAAGTLSFVSETYGRCVDRYNAIFVK